MTNDIAKADEMKAVERWENEGGKVSTFKSMWASLRRSRTEEDSRGRQLIDAQKSRGQQSGFFAGFNLRGTV